MDIDPHDEVDFVDKEGDGHMEVKRGISSPVCTASSGSVSAHMSSVFGFSHSSGMFLLSSGDMVT